MDRQKNTVSMSKYFVEPKYSRGRSKGELDLSNYATKSDFKNVTSVDTTKFAKKLIQLI